MDIIIVLGVGVLVVGFCALFVAVVDMFRQDEIARAYAETGVPLTDAAPAPESPAQGPERAQPGECMRLDCHEPIAVVIHGWGVCLGHDPRAPFDQDITPESVIEAAREITRRAVA
jgi:hypothetical protein